MIDFSKTPGYYPGFMKTYYVKCPGCGKILQEKAVEPLLSTVVCRHCHHKFQAYGNIREEEE